MLADGAGITIRRLDAGDAEAAARIHRSAFDERLPWLAGLHTPAEDLGFWRDQMLRDCQVFGACDGDRLIGVMALRAGWIEQLYVLPDAQGRGAGGQLVALAQAMADQLSLWTFQRNAGARAFYERRGFVAMAESDGSRNQEREPDVLYRWQSSSAGQA